MTSLRLNCDTYAGFGRSERTVAMLSVWHNIDGTTELNE